MKKESSFYMSATVITIAFGCDTFSDAYGEAPSSGSKAVCIKEKGNDDALVMSSGQVHKPGGEKCTFTDDPKSVTLELDIGDQGSFPTNGNDKHLKGFL